MVKVIYTDGIYDLFHRGHLERFLKIKEKFPDSYLIVGVINDQDATKYKRVPVFNQEDRYNIIENLRCVDKVIRDAPLFITEEFMNTHNIDLVVHGFENTADSNKQSDFFDIPKKLNKFLEMDYYHPISMTKILVDMTRTHFTVKN